jgi:hypothetical protein
MDFMLSAFGYCLLLFVEILMYLFMYMFYDFKPINAWIC